MTVTRCDVCNVEDNLNCKFFEVTVTDGNGDVDTAVGIGDLCPKCQKDMKKLFMNWVKSK